MDKTKPDFHKTARFLLKIFGNALIALFLILIITLTLPYFLELRPYYVMSGSMETTIPYGSIVYVKTAEFDEIKPQDIATFYSKKNPKNSFTHRIVSKDVENRNFTTKGDANPVADPIPVGADQLVGKVVFTVPYAGYPSVFLQNKLILLLVSAVILLWLSAEIELKIRKKHSKEEH